MSEKPLKESKTDIDGRRRMPINVLTSWGALLLQAASGFIIPRLIDKKLGQHALGVWDFSWAIVTNFSLVQAGITSSVNRYVARYNSVGDVEGVNRSVSSVTAVLFSMGILILILAAVCSFVVLDWFSAQLGPDLEIARWTVLLLGASIAVQVSMSAFGGVLTGLHRWDLHNAVYAVSNLVTLIAMLGAIFGDLGLIGLAGACLVAEVIGWGIRFVLSYRVYPELRVSLRFFKWQTAREMLGFGGKTFVPQAGELLMNQAIGLLIAGYLGPSVLALYSRPRALVNAVRTFINKYALVFSPSASSLDGMGEREKIRQLLTKATRFAVYLCLPIVITLVLMGGEILDIWMGAAYRQGAVVAIMSISFLFLFAYLPLLQGIMGLNLHGRPGLAIFIAQCAALILAFFSQFVLNSGLIGIAVGIGIPFLLVYGAFLPVYACRKIQMPVGSFLISTWKGPLLCCAPFTLCLLIGKVFFAGSSVKTLLSGIALGMAVLAFCYWKWVLPESWKSKIASRFQAKRS